MSSSRVAWVPIAKDDLLLGALSSNRVESLIHVCVGGSCKLMQARTGRRTVDERACGSIRGSGMYSLHRCRSREFGGCRLEAGRRDF